MEPELFRELTELIRRWDELAEHARTRAQAHPNGTYDGYMLGLEVATDDLTRVLGQVMKEREVLEYDN